MLEKVDHFRANPRGSVAEWWTPGAGGLIFLVLIGVAIVVVVRNFTASGGRSRSAEDLLAERFAAGALRVILIASMIPVPHLP